MGGERNQEGERGKAADGGSTDCHARSSLSIKKQCYSLKRHGDHRAPLFASYVIEYAGPPPPSGVHHLIL